MSKPTEHKTVQARILAYAEAIGWIRRLPNVPQLRKTSIP